MGDGTANLGKVQWSDLSAVIHRNWYGLVQVVMDRPSIDVHHLGPSLAMIGTSSKSSMLNPFAFSALSAMRDSPG